MTSPLQIHLDTTRAGGTVNDDVRDFTFDTAALGGLMGGHLELNRPLDQPNDDIRIQGTCHVTDARTTETIYDGKVEDPGRSIDGGGPTWRIALAGPGSLANDNELPVVYADRDAGHLERVDTAATPGGSDTIQEDPGGSGLITLVQQFRQGLTVQDQGRVVNRYTLLRRTGQKLARVDYRADAGTTDPAYRVQLFVRGPGLGQLARDDPFTTAGVGSRPSIVGTYVTPDGLRFSNGADMADFRILRDGVAAGIGTDAVWASYADLYIRALLLNADGTEKLTSYNTPYVLLSEIVADMLPRYFPLYDGASAVITPTTNPIYQAAYPTPIHGGRLLDSLIGEFEPSFTWGAWARRRPTDAKYPFRFEPWQTTARYELGVDDGVNFPASGIELFNRVVVTYLDSAGVQRSVTLTQTVPELGGRQRTKWLDLGSETGSAESATLAGQVFLAEHRTAYNAGTATVRRRIVDLFTGRMVEPWEIRAPALVRVTNVVPRVDALNATDRDALSVFRLHRTTYRMSTNSATLYLDSLPRNLSGLLARQRELNARTRRR